jgi:REP element-mobilizing transposase RayT
MPRKPREKSPHDLYHIVFRGTNKQVLFESKYDYMKFLALIQKSKNQIGFELHAYCLMSNHIHMLVKVPYDNLSKIALGINAPYAHFYNLKYSRTGHLFEIRFGSFPILTTQQYMNTIRYIHQNPVHAALISNQNAHKYPWSSMKEFKNYSKSKYVKNVNGVIYANEGHIANDAHIANNPHNAINLSDPHIVFDAFGAKFFSFHSVVSEECAYEHDCHRRTDQEAAEAIKCLLGGKIEFLKDMQKMDKISRNALISEIKTLKLSITQISRLTGIGKNIIQRVKEK